jgi:hypothetical protein
MQPSSSISEQARTPTDPTTRSDAPRLRTVTGNPVPLRCACASVGQIPRDPELRYVVDFGGPKPFKTYLREHSPDFGTYRGGTRAQSRPAGPELPGFVRASKVALEPGDSSELPRGRELVGRARFATIAAVGQPGVLGFAPRKPWPLGAIRAARPQLPDATP